MKFLKLQRSECKRYLLAVLAGLLLAGAFPNLSLAGLAWIAPGLMLGAALGMNGKAAFRIGFVAGLTFFLASLSWLLRIPVPLAPIVGWLALSGYSALYPAFWVWLCWSIYPHNFRRIEQKEKAWIADDNGGPNLRFSEMLDDFLGVSWLHRLSWVFLCAALWVALEIIRARLFSGFPWSLLGNSQFQVLPLIQISAWTGVYGVSFLVAWFSVALLGTAAVIMRKAQPAWVWGREFLVPLLAVAVVLSAGLHRVFTAPGPEAKLKVLLVQPSIPQTMIWDSKESTARFQQLIELTEKGLTNQPDLVIWPEAAVPSLFRWDTNVIYKGQTTYEAITGLARKYQSAFIIGADDAAPRPGSPDEVDYFNSSFLINSKGQVAANYRKQALVIFGEYVPLSRWLPFLMDFAHVYGEFTPGKGPVAFKLPDLRLNVSVLICFEDVFPHLARHYVQEDTDFLVNLTNDGWFGEGSAQWQQAASAVFRAVENGLPLVRDTNNGLTCWIDAYGGIHDADYRGFKNIYEAGFKISHVPVLAGAKRPLTFYTRHGDWFGWGCVALAGVVAVANFLGAMTPRRRSKAEVK